MFVHVFHFAFVCVRACVCACVTACICKYSHVGHGLLACVLPSSVHSEGTLGLNGTVYRKQDVVPVLDSYSGPSLIWTSWDPDWSVCVKCPYNWFFYGSNL